MLTPYRRIAYAVAAFLTALLAVSLAGVVPLFGALFNVHSTLGGFVVMGLLVLAVCLLGALLLGIPSAVQALVRFPEHCTPLHISVTVAGCATVLVLGAWLLRIFSTLKAG